MMGMQGSVSCLMMVMGESCRYEGCATQTGLLCMKNALGFESLDLQDLFAPMYTATAASHADSKDRVGATPA